MSRGWDQGSRALGEGPWRQLKSGGSWDDLALPEDFLARLRELPELYREPSATTARGHPSLLLLFGGARGMGKTCAAIALASELGLAPFEADIGEILAQEPADAARSVTRLLDDARRTAGVFVLDAPGAMLRGRRAGALSHPEVITSLLTLDRKEERLPGIVIVCAELIHPGNQGPQLQFDRTLVFPDSSAAIRERIWRRHLPRDHEISISDVVYLAQVFRLTGKAIASCCAAAERSAAGRPVTLADISEQLQAEYVGRLTSDRTRAALRDLRDRAPRPSGATKHPNGGKTAPAATPATELARRLRPVGPDRETTEHRRSPEPHAPARRGLSGRLMAAITVGGATAATALGFALSYHTKARPVAASRHAVSGPPATVISYRAALARALMTLNQARTRFSGELTSARTPAAQAQAAFGLAAAHAGAASSLGSVDAGPAASGNRALVVALQNAAGAYGALAQAAQKRDQRAYARAQRQVSRAEAALASAVRQVRAAAS